MEIKFEQWALVEIMGHVRIAGLCTEQSIAGVNMLRVDVPETPTKPAFTKFFGGSSIYAINPVTEEVCHALAKNLDKAPIQVYDVREMVLKLAAPINGAEDRDPDDSIFFDNQED
jgi:hypothetical protein